MTRLPTTTVDDQGLRKSLMVSGTLHLLALLFIFFGLPSFLKPLPAPPDVQIPIDIVDIADITNTQVKREEQPPQPPAPPPKPEEQKAAAPPVPPPPVPQPPTPPKPQEAPQEKVEAVLPKPTEKPKPPPKPVDQKQQQEALQKVLKNLEHPKTPPAVKTPDVKTPEKTQAPAQPVSHAPSLSERLTISENDAIKRQIESHWNVPIGARDVQSMVVQVHITVNADRSVQNVEVVDKSRMATDSYFRAMAESVVRAVYASSPLELPPDKYETWKDIDANFSAKDML